MKSKLRIGEMGKDESRTDLENIVNAIMELD